jgi:hypothetical protein
MTTKSQKAREIALKYTDKPYAAALNLIMEETPCKKTTAHSALKWAQKQKAKPEKPEAPTTEEKPTLQVISDKDKAPPFLEKPEAAAEVTPEVVTEAKPEAVTAAEQEQLDLFKSMFRGVYTLLFSEKGLAGKYGRSKEQCEMLADQQYNWLLRRYSVEQLNRFDTLLLIGAYATVLGGMAKDWLADRRKKAEKA